MRIAGLGFSNGHVLVHRAKHESFWTFPGGGAEIGETSEQTLVREMEEVLEPVRAVRPSKGGTGWSEDAIVWLRTSSSVDLAPLCGGE